MNEFEIYKTRLCAKGQVALPGEVREILNIKEGDEQVFRANEQGKVIVERALLIPPEQARF